MGGNLANVLIVAFSYALVTLSLWVTLDSGQFSVAHATLMGLGGYAGGIASVRFEAPFPVALLAGCAAGAAAGLIFAVVLLRTGGVLLGTITIALGQGIALSIQNVPALGGSQGYSGIPLVTTLPWAAGVAAAGLAAVLLVRRTRFGMGVHAAGTDETVARSLGISVTAARLYGFGMGGALAGLGGVLLAHYNGIIEPANLSFAAEPLFFIFLMIGGVTTPWGAVAGAVGVWLLQEALRFGDAGRWWLFDQEDRYWILGVLLILVLLVRPDGLLTRRPLRRRSRRRGLRRPLPSRPVGAAEAAPYEPR